MLTIKRKVTVQLTPDEWQIYSTMPGAKGAAKSMNSIAGKALSMPTSEEAMVYWSLNLGPFYKFGAGDTEPRWVFQDMVDEVFGGK